MQLLKVLLVVLFAVNLSAGFFFKKKKVYVHQPAPVPAPEYRYAYYLLQPVYYYQIHHQPPVAASGYASYYNQPKGYSDHTAQAYSAPAAQTPSVDSQPKPDNQNPVLTPVVVSEPTTPPPVLVPAAPVLTPLEVPAPTTPAPTLVLTNPEQTSVDVGTTVISNTQALPAFEAASF